MDDEICKSALHLMYFSFLIDWANLRIYSVLRKFQTTKFKEGIFLKLKTVNSDLLKFQRSKVSVATTQFFKF